MMIAYDTIPFLLLRISYSLQGFLPVLIMFMCVHNLGFQTGVNITVVFEGALFVCTVCLTIYHRDYLYTKYKQSYSGLTGFKAVYIYHDGMNT